MRWYKTCLLEGRLPFLCPDVQYPVGAPLGNFSPLHYQSLLYMPLSFFVPECDEFCYNIIWMLGFFTTGLGTFFLAWHALRDRRAAAFAGLLALLSTPVRLHGYGHLELVHVGWFPLFLLAWIRFVDRPGRGRLLAAAGSYVLLAMSAAYFMVFAVFPAVLYVGWRAVREGRRGALPWLRARLGWAIGFVVAAVPCLLLLFSSQIWATTHGFSMSRPKSEFFNYGAPLWSYLVPPPGTLMAKLMPTDLYAESVIGKGAGERASYLGIVTLLLLNYAAVRRVGFAKARFWWALLGMLVLLSMGARFWYGTHEVRLPAAWLWKAFLPFRLIRVPARFNLFASVAAAVVAGAGLAHLLDRIRLPIARAGVYAALVAVAFADLTSIPFGLDSLPPMPKCYAWLRERAPKAALLEIPQDGSTGLYLTAACAYWQSLHRGISTGGYSGIPNTVNDNLVTTPSPFLVGRLSKPEYLEHPEAETIDLSAAVSFDDYSWLYLKTHRLDYVVLHQWKRASDDMPAHLDLVKALLAPAKVYEDADTIVYEAAKLKAPTRPVLVCTRGWRQRIGWRDRYTAIAPREAELVVYSPGPDRTMTLDFEGAALRLPKAVRLLRGSEVLARWQVTPGDPRTYASPPLRLPAGLHTLSLVSDSEDPPRGRREVASEADTRPYSLRVVGLAVRQGPPAAVASRPGEGEGRH